MASECRFQLRLVGWVCTALLLVVSGSAAQSNATDGLGYQVPPREIVKLVEAPPTPAATVGPRGVWMALFERPSLPPLSETAKPELRLAGLRLNPVAFEPSRRGYFTGLSLVRIADGKRHEAVGMPGDFRIRTFSWSPDGRFLALTKSASTESGEPGFGLWLTEVESGRSWSLTEARLNAVLGQPCVWLPDSQGLLCRTLAMDRPSPPVPSPVPDGPVVQESLGRRAPARTYQDLLKNSHDAALFEYYAHSQLVRIGIDGRTSELGTSGLLRRAVPSPDGRYVLVERIERPFSYLVPFYRFPLKVEVRDRSGSLVRTVARLPLAEEVPIARDAVPTGPRSFGWRSDAGSTLVWAEAQDGGDPAREAEVRDRVYALRPPFDGEPRIVVSLGQRFASIQWGGEKLALVSERWWKSRRRRVWQIDPSQSGQEPRKLFDYSFQDRYGDPGSPMTRVNEAGRRVLVSTGDGSRIYLAGAGASAEGDRPFLDELDLATGARQRLWRSQAPHYETPLGLLDPEKRLLLTRRESTEEPANYFRRDLVRDKMEPLTDFPHPTPQLLGVHKELIRYERKDGVQLTATLYLPAGYEPEEGPLPMLMWAYPREFKSAKAASQVTGSPHRFVRVGSTSPLLWLARGYAILDNPSMPIVGEGETEPNDTYVKQLVWSAEAAVEEVVRRGVADRRRIAIGGHSYGAFMTANLLAHSDLFAAGIARSGAYNRTLTPFGFQSEERTLWQAPSVYFQMSPFMHVEKVNEPILLLHGQADNNSGTFPMQSERYYSALKGFGATARLVMLPHESHGYRSRESVLHCLWEMNRWLDLYTQGAGEPETPSGSGDR